MVKSQKMDGCSEEKTMIRCDKEIAMRRNGDRKSGQGDSSISGMGHLSWDRKQGMAEEKIMYLILDLLRLKFLWNIQVEILHKELNILNTLEFGEKIWNGGVHLERCIKIVIWAIATYGIVEGKKMQ